MKEKWPAVLPFLLPCLVPALVLTAYWNGAAWAFRAVIWSYLAALVLDFVGGEDTSEPRGDAAIGFCRLITWLWFPLQLAVIVTGLVAVTVSPDWRTLYVVSIAAGGISGMFGIPVAHELMHRSSRLERTLAELQMSLFTYAHFCIEHVEGHHHNVGLRRDPATARFGESLYAFLPRTVLGGYLDAWRLEIARLRAAGHAVHGPHNRMLRYLVLQLVMIVAIAAAFGGRGVAFFLFQSAVGILIVEVLNYVEHYGIRRREHEPVTDRHSWNSSHRISNWLMFNVPRHSDHHADAARAYPQLRHAGADRQLPVGYFAMFVLALFPPLWRSVMDPLIAAEER